MFFFLNVDFKYHCTDPCSGADGLHSFKGVENIQSPIRLSKEPNTSDTATSLDHQRVSPMGRDVCVLGLCSLSPRCSSSGRNLMKTAMLFNKNKREPLANTHSVGGGCVQHHSWSWVGDFSDSSAEKPLYWPRVLEAPWVERPIHIQVHGLQHLIHKLGKVLPSGCFTSDHSHKWLTNDVCHITYHNRALVSGCDVRCGVNLEGEHARFLGFCGDSDLH